jgi:3-phosphoshikimate 1-carboxyvinyltransferase
MAQIRVQNARLGGTLRMPGSKSHTIRAVALASLAEGTSTIRRPLDAADTRACVRAFRALGADIRTDAETWTVTGTAGEVQTPPDVVDVGNSGTTLYVAMGAASLGKGWTVLTGDAQIRNRPAQSLIEVIGDLGGEAFSMRGDGRPPVVVRGPIRGGPVDVDAGKTSQYLTSVLLATPLAERDTKIRVTRLVERPYIEMTLGWLERQGVHVQRADMDYFLVPGKQTYTAFDAEIPGDFSSATFFLCAAAITGSTLTLEGLDPADTQGDKAVLDMLAAMGAAVEPKPGAVTITGGKLRGGAFDLNATPDALPALAVTACFAEGETRLANVPQARLKETDRIAVMCEELGKMGGDVEELEDGLVIRGAPLRGARVDGRGDHRVVMALAVAGLAAEGETVIDTAESVAVTFPTFTDLLRQAGAEI